MKTVLDLSSPVAKVTVYSRRRPVRFGTRVLQGSFATPAESAILAEEIAQLLKKNRIKRGKLALLLPSTAVLERVLSLPPVPKRYYKELIHKEVTKLWRLDPADVYLIWHVVEQRPRLKVFVALIQRDLVAQYRSLLRGLRFRCHYVHLPSVCLQAALPGGTGVVVHLSEEGVVVVAGFRSGNPVQINRGFARTDAQAAQEIMQILRSLRSGPEAVPPQSAVVVTGPMATDELVEALQLIGLPAIRPAWAKSAFPMDAVALSQGVVSRAGKLRLVFDIRPRWRPGREFRRFFVTAGMASLFIGAVLGAVRVVEQLDGRIIGEAAALEQRWAGLDQARAALTAVRETEGRLTAFQAEVAAVSRRSARAGAVFRMLEQLGREAMVELSIVRPNQDFTELAIEGSANALDEVDTFVRLLDRAPFQRAYLARFDGEVTYRFTVQVGLQGSGVR